MKNISSIILTFIVITVSSVCIGETMVNDQSNGVTGAQIDNDSINKLANIKIFFGHQSVGGNVIEGIESLLDESQKRKLRIVKSNQPDSLIEPGLVHFYMGENGDPFLKIKEFSDSINSFQQNMPDVAMFKFCYLDVDKNTNVKEVFNKYKHAMADLKQSYPQTNFVHMTVPLTVKDSFFRDLVKNIIGRPDNNINRAIFNEMLLEEYSDKESVFDLAAIESTRVDGTRVELKTSDVKYYALADEYAADNGHLNKLGKHVVSRKLIEFIIDLDK